jgi:hypothetical protein
VVSLTYIRSATDYMRRFRTRGASSPATAVLLAQSTISFAHIDRLRFVRPCWCTPSASSSTYTGARCCPSFCNYVGAGLHHKQVLLCLNIRVYNCILRAVHISLSHISHSALHPLPLSQSYLSIFTTCHFTTSSTSSKWIRPRQQSATS